MISAIIAPAVSIVDKTAEQQAKRQELLRQHEFDQQAQHSFKPQINPNSNVKSVYAADNQKEFS